MDVEVAVIGAGPAGLVAAREAASAGARTAVFEEHQEVGIPVSCAGLLSVRGLRWLGFNANENFVENKIRGAILKSPAAELVIEAKEIKACVVDRSEFDRALAEQAEGAGVSLLLGSRVTQLICKDGHVNGLNIGGTKVGTCVVIDCEGSRWHFTEQLGLGRPRGLLPAAQCTVKASGLNPDYVEVHLDSRLAPGFFSYVIPLDERRARVGLASRRGNPMELLSEFIRRRFKRFDLIDRLGGTVITGGPLPRTYAGGFLVAGDAAGQTKPTTGGGVIFGALCSALAGRVASEAVTREDTSPHFLSTYQEAWKERLGREFLFMRLVRSLLNVLPDRAIDKMLKAASAEDVRRFIEIRGDVDLQSSLLSPDRPFMRMLLALVKSVIAI